MNKKARDWEIKGEATKLTSKYPPSAKTPFRFPREQMASMWLTGCGGKVQKEKI